MPSPPPATVEPELELTEDVSEVSCAFCVFISWSQPCAKA